jgi:hypothetical protein
MGRGSGQFAESAVDTLSVARNRDRWCGRTKALGRGDYAVISRV